MPNIPEDKPPVPNETEAQRKAREAQNEKNRLAREAEAREADAPHTQE